MSVALTPVTSSVLRRDACPRTSVTSLDATPHFVAMNTTSASFALPSTGGAARRTLMASPCLPTMLLRDAPGCTYTVRRTPPGVAAITETSSRAPHCRAASSSTRCEGFSAGAFHCRFRNDGVDRLLIHGNLGARAKDCGQRARWWPIGQLAAGDRVNHGRCRGSDRAPAADRLPCGNELVERRAILWCKRGACSGSRDTRGGELPHDHFLSGNVGEQRRDRRISNTGEVDPVARRDDGKPQSRHGG